MTKGSYWYKKDHGLCVRCGDTLPEEWGYVLCAKCKSKTSRKHVKPEQIEPKLCPEDLKEIAEYEKKAKETKKRKQSVSLDVAHLEAKNKGMSYAEMQKQEILKRIREQEGKN